MFYSDSMIHLFSYFYHLGCFLIRILGNSLANARPLRFKRQIYNLPGPYQRPFFVPTSNNPLLPQSVFNQGFAFGTDINPALQAMFDGGMRMTVIDKDKGLIYPWDLDGGFNVGLSDIQVGYGQVLNPANPFDVPIGQMYPCLLGLCGKSLSG